MSPLNPPLLFHSESFPCADEATDMVLRWLGAGYDPGYIVTRLSVVLASMALTYGQDPETFISKVVTAMRKGFEFFNSAEVVSVTPRPIVKSGNDD